MGKANKNFKLIEHKSSLAGRERYHVYLDGQHVAEVNKHSTGSGWRFRLDNYSHHHSKQYGTLKACLAALEKEVL